MVCHKAPVLANLFFCVIDLPRYEERHVSMNVDYSTTYFSKILLTCRIPFIIIFWAYRTKIESNRSVAIMLDTIVQD